MELAQSVQKMASPSISTMPNGSFQLLEPHSFPFLGLYLTETFWKWYARQTS